MVIDFRGSRWVPLTRVNNETIKSLYLQILGYIRSMTDIQWMQCVDHYARPTQGCSLWSSWRVGSLAVNSVSADQLCKDHILNHPAQSLHNRLQLSNLSKKILRRKISLSFFQRLDCQMRGTVQRPDGTWLDCVLHICFILIWNNDHCLSR